MSRALHKLSARRVETIKAPGWHGDGGGLWLRVGQDGSRRWVFTWERNKRRREMGLGSASDVTLAAARELAASARTVLADGGDPIELRRSANRDAVNEAALEECQASVQSTPLFSAFATAYINGHEDGWKNAKHRQQWRNSIETHGSSLLNKPVDQITSEDLVAVLTPIWRRIPETASRLRGRIENILDAAKASKHIASPWENPARWRGNLIHLLPRRRKKSQVKHHAAMPYDDLPGFYRDLRTRPATAARALELTILCATRTNEALRMEWQELDLDAAVWTIPAERMKMGIEHRIPLSDRAVEILTEISSNTSPDRTGYVFQGQRRGSTLSQMSMTMLLRRMKLGHFTVHGMRSGFRDYMGDMTDHPETIIEQALAHQIGDETSRAYRRGDAFLKRRAVMQTWEKYLLSEPDKKPRK